MTRYVHRCRSVSFRSGLHRNIPFRVMQVIFCFRWRANMVSKKILIKTGKILLPVIIAAGKPVFDAARRKFSSKTATPVPGSILFCELDVGYAEHSGIYVGGGDKCIIELANIDGSCMIKRVTPEEFVNGGLGSTIYISCHHNTAVGREYIASTAETMVGKCLGDYSFAKNNCHMFTDYCICSSNIEQGPLNWEKLLKSLKNHEMKMTLDHVKKRAREIMNADQWLKWDYQAGRLPTRDQ